MHLYYSTWYAYDVLSNVMTSDQIKSHGLVSDKRRSVSGQLVLVTNHWFAQEDPIRSPDSRSRDRGFLSYPARCP